LSLLAEVAEENGRINDELACRTTSQCCYFHLYVMLAKVANEQIRISVMGFRKVVFHFFNRRTLYQCKLRNKCNMLKRSNFVNLQIKVANVYGLSTQKLTLGLKKERKLRKKERTKTLRNLANLLAKCIMKTR